MQLTRRNVLGLTAGAAAFAVAGGQFSPALASAEDAEKMVMDFTGGVTPGEGKVSLNTPGNCRERQYCAGVGHSR
jgi:sulfur-oxidizing protein SoxY